MHRLFKGSTAGLLFAIAAGYGLGTWTLPLTAIADPPAKKPQALTVNGIDVLFSPHGGCTDRIVRELNTAKKSVRMQAYSFTSSAIAKALVAAHRRGIDV